MTTPPNLDMLRPGWADEYPDIASVVGMKARQVAEAPGDYNPNGAEDELFISLGLVEQSRSLTNEQKRHAKGKILRGWLFRSGGGTVIAPEVFLIAEMG